MTAGPALGQGAPLDAQGWEQLASQSIASKDYASATIDVEQAIAIDPGQTEPYSRLVAVCAAGCADSANIDGARLFDNALDFLHRLMPSAQASTPPALTRGIADAEVAYADYLRARSNRNEAIRHELNAFDVLKSTQPHDASQVLNTIAGDYWYLGDYRNALKCASQCLEIGRQIKDDAVVGQAYLSVAQIYSSIGIVDGALANAERAASIFDTTKAYSREASACGLAAGMCAETGRQDDEFTWRNRAFTISQKADIPTLDAAATNLAKAYADRLDYRYAVGLYSDIVKSTEPDGSWQASAQALSDLADVYDDMGRTDRELICRQWALADDAKLRRYDSNLPAYVAKYAAVLCDSKQYDDALKVIDEEIATESKSTGVDATDRADRSFSLYVRGLIYEAMGDQTRAIKDVGSSIAEDPADHSRQMWALSIIGDCYRAEGNFKSSEQSYRRSIAISRRYGYAECDQAGSIKLALLLDSKNDDAGAYDALTESAILYPSVESPNLAKVLAMMMIVEASRGHLALATLYGKQSVEEWQTQRRGLQMLDQESEDLATVKAVGTYRYLAGCLIRQNRLAEALEVYDLMKRREFDEFSGTKSSPAHWDIPLTSTEQGVLDRSRQLTVKIAATDRLIDDIEVDRRAAQFGIGSFGDANRASLAGLEASDAAARAAYAKFVKQLYSRFAQPAVDPGERARQSTLDARAAKLGSGSVILYTLACPDRCYIIAVGGGKQVWASSPVAAANLDKKIEIFREALQDPTIDARKPAADLYDILFKPIEPFLNSVHAKRLLWALDGSLRYCPVAALFDGRQYLIQRYACEEFTVGNSEPTPLTKLDTPSSPPLPKREGQEFQESPNSAKARGGDDRPEALGLGVSKSVDGFDALPNVVQEIGGLIGTSNAPGILGGTEMLDEQFTRASMEAALDSGKYRTVHIASHFVVCPGDDTQSFLLMGDGDKFSLADMEAAPNLFQGVDLLTLSACDTAMGSTRADGREIDGCAIVAQRDGAANVIASLWPIADASTPLLMQTFYRLRRDHPGMSEADALRQAQLALLNGTADMANVAGPTPRVRGKAQPDPSTDSALDSLPDFSADQSKPFAHPCYWAPFILIGKWQ